MWELPAVLLADAAENDLVRLEKSAPKSDTWRVICMLDGDSHPPAKLHQRIFAVVPREAPNLVLEKTVERAFESLHAQEEHAAHAWSCGAPFPIWKRSTKSAWRFPPSATPTHCWN